MALLKKTGAGWAALRWGTASVAGNCLPPIAALTRTDADDVLAYADLLRYDAEAYSDDVEQYFQCQDQDQERREVFEQVRKVSEDYARVLEILGSDS